MLTRAQTEAINARGNIIVVAGAGTGKTRTLIERCLSLIGQGCAIEQMLLVTFTEASATEMRHRIRQALQQRLSLEPSTHFLEQLALVDTANISTLHSLCLQLVRQHFYELHLDPQFAVLDERQTRPLITETLDLLLNRCYAETSEHAQAVRDLIRKRGRGADLSVRGLVIQLHRFSQTLPHPESWLNEQFNRFSNPEPIAWQACLIDAVQVWRDTWRPMLDCLAADCSNIRRCHEALSQSPPNTGPLQIGQPLLAIATADQDKWKRGDKGKFRKPLARFFAEADFLRSLCPVDPAENPLAEDWNWTRHDMLALLWLAQQFSIEFSRAKLERGGLDFSDLEQQAHRLLVDPVTRRPTTVAQEWQERLRFIFVDEYQDINAVQDAIIAAVSRGGADANRFLVGDAKQSIYRFRLANPRIFSGYETAWTSDANSGQRLLLSDNFRSREGILEFANQLFSLLMRRAAGGLDYPPEVHLRFGDPDHRTPLRQPSQTAGSDPRVEWHCILRGSDQAQTRDAELPLDSSEPNSSLDVASAGNEPPDDLTNELPDLLSSEKEARLVALRLKQLQETGHPVWDTASQTFRPVAWRDMVVLLRSPSSKVEAFAKEFHRAGVPLLAVRGGFFQTTEVTDLLCLLQLLDNPLQDLPLLAVLRSPLAGISLDELVEIRVCVRKSQFWTALNRFHDAANPAHRANAPDLEPKHLPGLWEKVDRFLTAYRRWRELIRTASLSHCLETVLADTCYESMLLAEHRGLERSANVKRLLSLVRQFDPFQRQGLFRFLTFVAAQQAEDLDEEPAPVPARDAVRLMSIHKSKGLEFPVVVVADLGKKFNLSSIYSEIILDEQLGLCPQVIPPDNDRRYPSLPYWLAQKREKAELLGEEMRLFYVAVTRARDTLILTGWSDASADEGFGPGHSITDQQILSARNCLAWLKLWTPIAMPQIGWSPANAGQTALLRWQFYAENDSILAMPPESPLRSPAPADADRSIDDHAFAELKRRLAWQYPYSLAASEPAKTTVSVLRRRMHSDAREDAQPARFLKRPITPSDPRQDRALSPSEIGTAHHRFLQSVSFQEAHDLAGLAREAKRIESLGILSQKECAALDLPRLARFWQSEIGQQIVRHAANAHRELPFTARFTLKELAGLGLNCISQSNESANAQTLAQEFVIVQGVLDLAVILPKEIWVLDFKTDAVDERSWPDRAAVYRPQLRLYSLALERIYQRPVSQSWLHFLSIQLTVPCL